MTKSKELNLSPSVCHQFLMSNTKQLLSYDGSDLISWQRKLRRKLKQLSGFISPEPIPLNARSLWKIEHKLGTIEKIAFTSEPYSDVLAYVSLPSNAKPPYTCMITLQGHSGGMHNCIARDREDETKVIKIEGDRDFALQCMQNGLAAISIEQRSFGLRRELKQQIVSPHGCHDAVMHSLMLGRTLVAERVLDISKALEYLRFRGDINMKKVGIMGNSGGGTISIYAAALLPAIKFAMPSCSFCSFRDSIMSIYHCSDNYIPGLLQFAESSDIAGLIAPRPLVIVAGEKDEIFPVTSVRKAYKKLKIIYKAADASSKCHLIVGKQGHRFYAKQAWPIMLRKIEHL